MVSGKRGAVGFRVRFDMGKSMGWYSRHDDLPPGTSAIALTTVAITTVAPERITWLDIAHAIMSLFFRVPVGTTYVARCSHCGATESSTNPRVINKFKGHHARRFCMPRAPYYHI